MKTFNKNGPNNLDQQALELLSGDIFDGEQVLWTGTPQCSKYSWLRAPMLLLALILVIDAVISIFMHLKGELDSAMFFGLIVPTILLPTALAWQAKLTSSAAYFVVTDQRVITLRPLPEKFRKALQQQYTQMQIRGVKLTADGRCLIQSADIASLGEIHELKGPGATGSLVFGYLSDHDRQQLEFLNKIGFFMSPNSAPIFYAVKESNEIMESVETLKRNVQRKDHDNRSSPSIDFPKAPRDLSPSFVLNQLFAGAEFIQGWLLSAFLAVWSWGVLISMTPMMNFDTFVLNAAHSTLKNAQADVLRTDRKNEFFYLIEFTVNNREIKTVIRSKKEITGGNKVAIQYLPFFPNLAQVEGDKHPNEDFIVLMFGAMAIIILPISLGAAFNCILTSQRHLNLTCNGKATVGKTDAGETVVLMFNGKPALVQRTYNYTVSDKTYHLKQITQAGRQGDDRPTILYDPNRPANAVAFEALPGQPTLEGKRIVAKFPGLRLLGLLLPVGVVTGHIFAASLFIKNRTAEYTALAQQADTTGSAGYETVFDISANSGFYHWFWGALPPFLIMLVMVLFLSVLLFLVRKKEAPGPKILNAVVLIVVLFFFCAYTSSQWPLYSGMRDKYLEGNCEQVEGVIKNFKPMPYSGHASEDFTVADKTFSYSDYSVTPAFNNTASHGGPAREGLQVKIWYSGDDILRFDVKR